MSKPVNPNIAIPSEFAAEGQKRNFSEEKIRRGFNSVAKDTLEGDCLNKFIDDTYKGLNYAMDGVEDLYDVTDDLKDLSNLSASGQAILDNKANKDLSNLSSTGEAHFANPDLSNLSNNGSNRLHALKGYLDNGTALTDSEGLADVINYAHSTYDSTKFTVTGSPTITSDGIISNISSSNYIHVDNIIELNANKFDMGVAFNATSFAAIQRVLQYRDALIIQVQTNGRLRFYASSTGDGTYDIANGTESTNALSVNNIYNIKAVFTGSQYIVYVNGTAWITVESTLKIANQTNLYIFSGRGSSPSAGSQDLKTLYVTVDGVPVFNGNKTAIDTYTIGGNTVTIPYTLSKTGSKIVDSVYRTEVTAVYNEYGYAPYYILDETNGNFTLPMGEIYGAMLNKSIPHVVESYQNGTSWYRVYSDGWCEQGGSVYIIGPDGGGTVAFLKPYKDTNYQIMITNASYLVTIPAGIEPASKLSGSMVIDYGDGTVTGDVYWETKGYIS